MSWRWAFAIALVVVRGAHAQSSPPAADGYRAELTLAHPIAGGFAAAPYVSVEDKTSSTAFRVAFPVATYRATSWLEGWGGISVTWTDAEAPGSSTRELRPYGGVKIYVPNAAHVRLYGLSLLEWRRITNTDSDVLTSRMRFRTRPSVEFPLTSRPWQPRTFYGLANIEAFVEHSFVDALRFASGAGYIAKDRMRIEFQYVAKLTRNSPDTALLYSASSLRLNVKLSFSEGLLRRLEGDD
jgi:hypothetical protein